MTGKPVGGGAFVKATVLLRRDQVVRLDRLAIDIRASNGKHRHTQPVRFRWDRWKRAMASHDLAAKLRAVYLDRPAELVGVI